MRKLYITSPKNFSHIHLDSNREFEYEFVIANDISLSVSPVKLISYQSITDGIKPDKFEALLFKSLKKYNENTKTWVSITPDITLHASEIHGTYRGVIQGVEIDKKITLYLRLVDSKNQENVIYSTVVNNVSTMTSVEVKNEIECNNLASLINIRNFIEYTDGDIDTDFNIEYKVTNNLLDDKPEWEVVDNALINSTNFYRFNNRTCKKTPKIGVKTIITAKPTANGKVLKFKDIYIGYQ